MKMIILLFTIFFISCGNYCLDVFKYAEFHGKISNKYIDDFNHATKMIVIEENGKTKEYPLFKNNAIEFWDYISIGDSIYKEKESLGVKIISGEIVRNFTFNCEN